jgi:hypothetical protein
MKYALDNITLEQLVEKIEDQGLDKEIFANLFGFGSGYKMFIKMDELGEIYLTVDSPNTSYRYEDYNPEIMTLNCWNLRDALRDADGYYECDENGKWGVAELTDYLDLLGYWHDRYSEHIDLEDLLRHRFESAKLDLMYG